MTNFNKKVEELDLENLQHLEKNIINIYKLEGMENNLESDDDYMQYNKQILANMSHGTYTPKTIASNFPLKSLSIMSKIIDAENLMLDDLDKFNAQLVENSKKIWRIEESEMKFASPREKMYFISLSQLKYITDEWLYLSKENSKNISRELIKFMEQKTLEIIHLTSLYILDDNKISSHNNEPPINGYHMYDFVIKKASEVFGIPNQEINFLIEPKWKNDFQENEYLTYCLVYAWILLG